jgi:hypothetical protein
MHQHLSNFLLLTMYERVQTIQTRVEGGSDHFLFFSCWEGPFLVWYCSYLLEFGEVQIRRIHRHFAIQIHGFEHYEYALLLLFALVH